MLKKAGFLAAAMLGLALGAGEVLIEEDFAFAKPGTQMPKGFDYFFSTKLKGETPNAKFEVRKAGDGCEIVFDDQCDKTGIGLRILRISVDPGATYRATVTVAALPGRDTKCVHLQLCSGKVNVSKPIDAPKDGADVTRDVEITIPAGQTLMDFHVFSVYDGKPGFVVKSVKIEETKSAPEVPVVLKPAEGSKILMNDDFSKYEVKEGVPNGYKLFAATKLKGQKPDMKAAVVQNAEGKKVLVVEDNCEKSGIGPILDFPAVGGKTYRASVITVPLPGRSVDGAVVQFNVGAKGKSARLQQARKGRPAVTTLDYVVPAGDSTFRIYIYSVWDAKPAYEIRQILVEELP